MTAKLWQQHLTRKKATAVETPRSFIISRCFNPWCRRGQDWKGLEGTGRDWQIEPEGCHFYMERMERMDHACCLHLFVTLVRLVVQQHIQHIQRFSTNTYSIDFLCCVYWMKSTPDDALTTSCAHCSGLSPSWTRDARKLQRRVHHLFRDSGVQALAFRWPLSGLGL